MDRRYLIFISSTFRDLIAERNEAARAVLDLGHIPAGMERFPAMDEEQMRYIQTVIDDCDYYLLIIGGKYGSVSPKTGLSYTEMEFDYACEKGLPVIVFEKSPIENSETDTDKREKLEAFRKKIKTSRLVKDWSDAKDLRAEIALSLPQQIKRKPAIGWVRGNTVASAELTAEQNALLKKNSALKAEVEKLKIELCKNEPSIPDIAGLNEKIPRDILNIASISQNYTWGEVFFPLALKLANGSTDIEFHDNWLNRVKDRIIFQFVHLALIRKNVGSYYLTPKGQRLTEENLLVRTQKSQSEEK